MGRIRGRAGVVAPGERGMERVRTFRDVAGIVAVDAETAHGLASTVRRALRESIPCAVVTPHPRERTWTPVDRSHRGLRTLERVVGLAVDGPVTISVPGRGLVHVDRAGTEVPLAGRRREG